MITNTNNNSRKIYDIKLIIGISNTISQHSLETMIIDSLESSLVNFESNSRFRLHPYVILPPVDASKANKNLSSNDIIVLESLKPLLLQLKESVDNGRVNKTFPDPDTTSVLKSIISFNQAIQSKYNKLANHSINIPSVPVFDYGLVVEKSCDSLEASKSVSIMPAFNAKTINMKRLPADINDSKSFERVIYVNIESGVLGDVVSSKKPKGVKEKVVDEKPRRGKGESVNTSKHKRREREKTVVLQNPLTEQAVSTSSPNFSVPVGDVSEEVKNKILEGLQ